MIEFVGKIQQHEVVVVRMENLQTTPDNETGDYTVHVAVRDKDGTEHLYQRAVLGFDRNRYNALGLLKAVLDSLDQEVFTLEHPGEAESPVSEDLARGLPRGMPEVQVW